MQFKLFENYGSHNDEGLGRIFLRSVFLILRWQKEEKERHTEEVSQLRLQKQVLPSICLCGLLYKASNRFGFEIWSYSQCGYNLDEFLDICVIRRSSNASMYPAII